LATISVIVSKPRSGKPRGGGAEAGHIDGLEAGLLGELRLQAIEHEGCDGHLFLGEQLAQASAGFGTHAK
jgi:hypothetical protein